MNSVERTIRGPEKEFLSDHEAAEWLGIEGPLFRQMVKDGVLPEGERYNRTTLRWRWEVIYAAGVLIGHLRKRVDGENEPEE